MEKIKFSPARDQILKILKENNINSLWHFTSIINLTLIKKFNGLRSKLFLEKQGCLNDVRCGGNKISHDLDKVLGNWDKISLGFTPHTPIAFQKKKEIGHLVFIEVDPEVAAFEGVYFTDSNATRLRNGHTREEGVRGLTSVKFNIINSTPEPWNEEWKKYVQAEVLVPNHIPIEYFKKIHFISEASLKLGQYLWSGNSNIFCINSEVFADYKHDESEWSIINPYVKEVIVSYEEITRENARGKHIDVGNVIQKRTFWMKIFLYAVTGSKVRLILKDLTDNIIVDKEVEFKNEDSFIWFPKIDIPKEYESDEIIIEIMLDEILWYKEKRKVVLK
ncbi:protein of unknown function [Thermoanaerobacter uzonensis DSM 18761]|uniref:DarT domain-containing protein n=1 Tax=Thermoanaerobacter uzonensis DSM 18761 TaxID=1123369 RepID=A0A1M4ZVX0_9THEO|nr:DarT ssDNA thymidine ADP-ribosyltransferase family protein [Thermoanaerobacter uzonensis]SHF22183.1 protein of unknown function [Thermoanaerobacter uzonensis DSM 18761]